MGLVASFRGYASHRWSQKGKCRFCTVKWRQLVLGSKDMQLQMLPQGWIHGVTLDTFHEVSEPQFSAQSRKLKMPVYLMWLLQGHCLVSEQAFGVNSFPLPP